MESGTDSANKTGTAGEEVTETVGEEATETADETLGTIAVLEVLGPCKRRIKASVPVGKVSEYLDKSYDELVETVQLPGFRRGRVPRRLLERRFGSEVLEDVKSALLNVSFSETLKQKELRILGEPRFENVAIAAQADFRYEAEFEVQPEFDLPEYIGLEVDPEPVSVDEKELVEQIEDLRREHGTLVPIEPSAAGPDDLFYGRYHLYVGEVRAKTATDVRFRPSTGVLESFPVENLGETVKAWDFAGGKPLSLDVTVPADYADEVLRGKKVRLEFHLEETKTLRLLALDDELARAAGFESFDKLRESVRLQLESRHKRVADRRLEKAITDKLLASVTLDLPEDLIESQRKKVESRREQELIARGVPKGEVDAERERAGTAAAAELRAELKELIVLEAIGDKEKIFVTEEEVKQRVQIMAMAYGLSANLLRDELRQSGRIEEVRISLRIEKVKTFLRRKAKVGVAAAAPEIQPEVAPAGPGT